jgi:hypothetical protein
LEKLEKRTFSFHRLVYRKDFKVPFPTVVKVWVEPGGEEFDGNTITKIKWVENGSTTNIEDPFQSISHYGRTSTVVMQRR